MFINSFHSFVLHFLASCLNAKSSVFFTDFVCGYLANHADVRQLVKLKENRYVLRFNDVGEITSIYCDFKEANGRKLKRALEKRRDNFKNIMSQFEKAELLIKVGGGIEYGKEYLKYEIKNSELWHSLRRNYSVQRNPRVQVLLVIHLKITFVCNVSESYNE